MPEIRCGVVEYVNALPLWLHLRQDKRFRIISGVPSKITAMLHAGELDIGLVPAIEYFRAPDLEIIPGSCISSRGIVESVRLFLKKPVQDLRSVRLDPSSRTSNAMVQVLLNHFHRVYPEYSPGATDPSNPLGVPEDASLLIGDPAMQAMAKHPEIQSLDLGKEWTKFTGLPFVYAAWLRKAIPEGGTTGGLSDRELIEVLADAAEKGRQSIPQIAEASAKSKGLKAVDVEIYLRARIRYVLTQDALEGLHYFAVKASELGLCRRKSIQLVGQRPPDLLADDDGE